MGGGLNPAAAPSILEIGAAPYLKQLWPECVTFVSVGSATPHPLADLVLLGPGALARVPALRRLCARAGLIACRIQHSPGRAWGLVRRAVVARRPGARLILLDFEDEDFIHLKHAPLLASADLVFKRELPVDRWRLARPLGLAVEEAALRATPAAAALMAKLRPLPLGLPFGGPEMPQGCAEKTADVFFAGAVERNAWLRPAGLAALQAMDKRGLRPDLPPRRLPPAEFLQRCAAAWLTWSPSGYGWDCFRHYEAAACGSVPLIPYPTIERYAGLQQGVHAVFYDPRPGGLEAAASAALADKPALARMAAAGREWVLRHHTPAAIGRYILAEAG